MDVSDAAALLAPAVLPAPRGGAPVAWWADLGAGRGTFTRALAGLLGPAGRVDAVDRDPAAIAALARGSRGDRASTPLAAAGTAVEPATVTAHAADFTDAAALDALGWPPLAGALLANALHFVAAPGQAAVLADLVARLAPRGRLVVVEYEDRAPSRWVPVPVPFARLGALVGARGELTAPVRIGTHPSAFGGTMYAAMLQLRS